MQITKGCSLWEDKSEQSWGHHSSHHSCQWLCRQHADTVCYVAFVRETENLLRLNPSSLGQVFKIIHKIFCVFWILGPWSKTFVLPLKLLVLESLQSPNCASSHCHHWDWASYAVQFFAPPDPPSTLLCPEAPKAGLLSSRPGLLRPDICWLWHSDTFVLWLGLTSVGEKFSSVQ